MEYVDNPTLDDFSTHLTDRELRSVVLNGRVDLYSFKRDKEKSTSTKGDESSAPALAPAPAPVPSTEAVPSLTVETIFNQNKNFRAAEPSPPSSSATAAATTTGRSSPRPSPAAMLIPNRRSTSTSPLGAVAQIRPVIGDRKPLRRRSDSMPDQNVRSAKEIIMDLISTLNDSYPDYDFSQTQAEQFCSQDIQTVIKSVNENLSELEEKDDSSSSADHKNFLTRLWETFDELMNLKRCDVFSYMPDMEGDPFSDGSLWSFNFFFVNQDVGYILYFTCVATSKFNTNPEMSGLDSGGDSNDEVSGESETDAYEEDGAGEDEEDADLLE